MAVSSQLVPPQTAPHQTLTAYPQLALPFLLVACRTSPPTHSRKGLHVPSLFPALPHFLHSSPLARSQHELRLEMSEKHSSVGTANGYDTEGDGDESTRSFATNSPVRRVALA